MNDNTESIQQQTTPTPEDSGGAGRMFTQDEVNRIVSDRLAREREKLTQQTAIDEREKALREREQAFEAKEARAAKEAAVRAYYESKNIAGKALDIAMKGSGAEIDALEMDGDKIKDYSSIDALIGGVFSGLAGHTVTRGADVPHPPMYGNRPTGDEQIANAFKPKI